VANQVAEERTGEAETSSLPRLLVFLEKVDSYENWKILNIKDF